MNISSSKYKICTHTNYLHIKTILKVCSLQTNHVKSTNVYNEHDIYHPNLIRCRITNDVMVDVPVNWGIPSTKASEPQKSNFQKNVIQALSRPGATKQF